MTHEHWLEKPEGLQSCGAGEKSPLHSHSCSSSAHLSASSSNGPLGAMIQCLLHKHLH